MSRLCEPCAGVAHELGLGLMLLEHALHAFPDLGVDIACAIARVRRQTSLVQGSVRQMPFPVDFLDQPVVAG